MHNRLVSITGDPAAFLGGDGFTWGASGAMEGGAAEGGAADPGSACPEWEDPGGPAGLDEDGQPPTCPVHADGVISRAGIAWRKAGPVRRWKCRPETDRTHLFVASDRGRRRLLSPVGAVVGCPQHPGSRLQRHGRVTKGGVEKERFRCYPVAGPRHTFAVPVSVLPEPGSAPRTGAPVAPRMGAWSPYSPQEVAVTLLRLGAGMTYRQASALIRPDDRPSAESSWRLSADWCEMFAPLVTAGRLPHRWPEEIFVGWVPLAPASASGAASSWGLLAAAERTGPQSGRLVAVSAAPLGDQQAWEEFFSRLQGRPRRIVGADDSWARGAAATVWAGRGGAPRWVSSHWHVRRSLRQMIRRDPLAAPLMAGVESALAGVEQWQEFVASVRTTTPDGDLGRFVAEREADLAEQLRWLATDPDALRTSAPIDPLTAPLRSTLGPRRGRLSNLERTQRLLDLMLAHLLRVDDPQEYVQVLEQVSADPGRWMPRRALAGLAGLRVGNGLKQAVPA